MLRKGAHRQLAAHLPRSSQTGAVGRRTALVAGSNCGTSALFAAARGGAAMGGGAGIATLSQRRGAASWDYVTNAWSGRSGVGRKTSSEEQLREELPEVFERPVEVEDYIRPDKTYFEQLEDLWDWAISFASPVDKQVSWMRSLHVDWGIEWGIVFMLWGTGVRLISLIPLLYSHRNTLRMARCSKQTSEITQNIKRIKNDKNLTTPERRVMTDGYKRMEKAIYKKYDCHKWGSMAAGASSPLLVTAFMAIRRLAAYEDDLESASFLWITDLTMPDPSMALPLICTVLFISNFEMNQRLNRGGRSAVGMYLRWGIRVGALGFTYYFSSQPACLFAYWIGMSTAGMLQPFLLRNDAFRRAFNFPERAKTAEAHDEQSPLKWMITRITNRQLTETAEEVEARRKAEEKRTKPKFETIDDQELILDDEPAARKTTAAPR